MSHKLRFIGERTMMFLLLLLAIVLKIVTPDKLTGSETPPAAVFSGGTLEDLQLPLEHFDDGSKLKVKEFEEEYRKEFKLTRDNFKENEKNDKDLFVVELIRNEDGIKNSVTTDRPAKKVTIEEKKLNTTLNPEFNKSNTKLQSDEVNTKKFFLTQDVAHNYEPYHFSVYGGNPIVVIPRSKSERKVNIIQSKSDYLSSDTLKSNSSYTPSNFSFDTFKPTTTKPNIYRKSNLRTKSKNVSDINKRRNPFLNKIDANSKSFDHQNVLNENTFSHKFRTSNGIYRQEIGTGINGVKVEGSYSYVGDDGKTYTVRYTADENGFRPQGDHLPFIPQAIKTVQTDVYDDGSYDEAKYGHLNYENVFIRRAYKQGLRLNKRRRKQMQNQEENKQSTVEKTQYKNNSFNPKLKLQGSIENIQPTSTETSIILESNNNKKGIYTIRRRPRKFNTENGFNKLYVVNQESTDNTNNLTTNDDVNNTPRRKKKVLNEFSKTSSTIGYIYGPPINKFNEEEQLINENKANIFKITNTDFKTNETDNKFPNDNKLQQKFTTIRDNIFGSTSEVTSPHTIDNFDKIYTQPYDLVNKGDVFTSNTTLQNIENALPKTELFTVNRKPSHLLNILEHMESKSDISDDILFLRKLFGIPNATKVEDFKLNIIDSKPIKDVKEFKSINKSYRPVNEEAKGLLNDTNVVNVEEVLRNIFGTGQDDESSNKNEKSGNNGDTIDIINENTNNSEKIECKEDLIKQYEREFFPGPKQIPKFDPDNGYYYK